jgi:hypothetical protein
MNSKNQTLASLNDVFRRWEDLLVDLSEEQINAPRRLDGLSIKDVIGHLRAWQLVSIARLAAARSGVAPVYPEWFAGLDPDAEEQTDLFNARIYDAHHRQSWSSVYNDWRAGFRRFLELAEAIPEEELLAAGRYPWLAGYALIDVLTGSYEHHVEHLEQL